LDDLINRKGDFRNGMPEIRDTVLDSLSQLNPVIKAPLERLFDVEFQTQRRLSDLNAPRPAKAFGRIFRDDNPQLLSPIMASSPLSRFFTSADKLMDPRKSLAQKLINLGNGVRVTDVDVDKQRVIEARNALESMLRGQPGISQCTSFYIKPEDQASLATEPVMLMRPYNTELQAAATRYARARRDQIGIQQ
jgi:hypothetical protein